MRVKMGKDPSSAYKAVVALAQHVFFYGFS